MEVTLGYDSAANHHERRAAALLERAARLAEAKEYDEAMRSMDGALTEINAGIWAKYVEDTRFTKRTKKEKKK